MNGSETDLKVRTQRIASALPEGGLFHEKSWRIAPQAFPLNAKLLEELDKLGYRLSLFLKACNLLYRLSVKGRQPAWIAELLDRGKPAALVEASREKIFADALPQVIRPDVILTEDGFIIAELDNVPGGIGLTAWLNREYAALGDDVIGGPDGMLEGFARVLPEGDIVVSEEASTYRPEMEWLAAQLCKTRPGRVWRVRGGDDMSPLAKRVYRFYELFDLANVPASGMIEAAARAGEVTLTPPLKPWLEEKLWFALFWLKPLENFWIRELGERQFRALQKVIPYSWIMDPAPLPPHAVLPRLEAHSWEEVKGYSQSQRELVLKVSGFSEKAWGSRGVNVGFDMSGRAWAEAVDEALAAFPTQPHLMQKFHHAALFESPYLDPETGEMASMRGRVRLCPYYFADEKGHTRLGGALTTLVPADKKLIHGMRDAILMPAAAAPAS